jgi:hypothetical protein
MGSETTRALTARRREASTRVDRLIVDAEARSPVGSVRRARISSTVRDGRRALKALSAAQRALADAEERAAAALILLTGDGLSCSEAYQSLGISRAVGRRLLEIFAPTRRTAARPSTGAPANPLSHTDRPDRETGSLRRTTTKGSI